jgi:hypothetical protein
MQFSRVYNDITGTMEAVDNSGGYAAINVSCNWWGSNADPGGEISSGVNYTPWLVLGATANSSAITTAQPSIIRANLTFDSNGDDTSGLGSVPDGIPVTFAIVKVGTGIVLPSEGKTTNGSNSTTFTPGATGPATVTATVDNQQVNVVIPTISPSVSL